MACKTWQYSNYIYRLHSIVYIDPTTGLNQHKQYNAIPFF